MQIGNKIWKLFKYSRSQLLLLWQWKFMKFFFPTQLIFPYNFYFPFLLPGIQPRKSLLIFQLDLWKYGKMISIIHWFNGVCCKKAQGYSPIAMNITRARCTNRIFITIEWIFLQLNLWDYLEDDRLIQMSSVPSKLWASFGKLIEHENNGGNLLCFFAMHLFNFNQPF